MNLKIENLKPSAIEVSKLSLLKNFVILFDKEDSYEAGFYTFEVA